jgi:hypothetical protein
LDAILVLAQLDSFDFSLRDQPFYAPRRGSRANSRSLPETMMAVRHALSRQEAKKKRKKKNGFQLEAQAKEVLNVCRSWKGRKYEV